MLGVEAAPAGGGGAVEFARAIFGADQSKLVCVVSRPVQSGGKREGQTPERVGAEGPTQMILRPVRCMGLTGRRNHRSDGPRPIPLGYDEAERSHLFSP
jgi:hypothetical protein